MCPIWHNLYIYFVYFILSCFKISTCIIIDILGVKALDAVLGSAPSNTDLSGVVDAYVHALVGRYPRCRYRVGVDSRWLALPILWLPTCLGDKLLKLVYWTDAKPILCKSWWKNYDFIKEVGKRLIFYTILCACDIYSRFTPNFKNTNTCNVKEAM